jgi:hypothetical protein
LEGSEEVRLRSVGAAKRPARAPANPFATPAGWHRGRVDWAAQFEKFQGKKPEEGDEFQLKKLVKYTRQGIAAMNESTFEAGHGMLGFYVRNGKFPGKKSRDKLVARAVGTVQAHVSAYHEEHSSWFSKLNPAKLIAAAGDVISKVGPFLDMAIKLVPGAGQIYSAAKAAVSIGMSLAKGRPLTDAFIDGALAAMPGGEIAQRAARAVVSLAKGRSLTGALLDQVKEQFPGAEKAITAAAGIAEGRRLQDIAIDEVKDMAASQLKGLKMPIPPGVEIPAGMRKGAMYAVGVLNNAKLPNGLPLTPAAALAIRNRLPKVQRLGFDRIMAMRALKNYRAGSPNIPRPRPLTVPRGTPFVTATGVVAL